MLMSRVQVEEKLISTIFMNLEVQIISTAVWKRLLIQGPVLEEEFPKKLVPIDRDISYDTFTLEHEAFAGYPFTWR